MTPADGTRRTQTRAVSGVIAALVVRTKDRFALRRDLRGLGGVRFSKDVSGLMNLVRESPVRLVIAEPRDPKLRETAPVIRAIRAAYPSIPILILCDPTAEDLHRLVDLVRAGADDAVVRGVDRIGAVAASLLARDTRPHLSARALDEMSDIASVDARAILAFAIENPAARRPVEQIARTLRVSRRTLVNRLSAAGLPGPSVFVAWGRLLVAASLLENPVRPIREVARALGLRSSAGLHVLCRRHSQLSVRELKSGGPRGVLELIRRELETAPRSTGRRSPAGERRRRVG